MNEKLREAERLTVIGIALHAAMTIIEERSRYRFPLHRPAESLAAQHIRHGIEQAMPLLDYES